MVSRSQRGVVNGGCILWGLAWEGWDLDSLTWVLNHSSVLTPHFKSHSVSPGDYIWPLT